MSARSVATGRRSAASSARRRTRALAAALALWAAWLAAPAQAADAFRVEGSATLPEPVGAVAINADESLIAAAVGDEGEVVFLDRRSRAVLGSLKANVGESPRLLFSPVRDLLLVWGLEGLELWNVSVSALKPAAPLAESHRAWRQEAPDAGPITHAAFTASPAAALWSAGKGIFRRETAPGAAAAEQPWLSDEEPVAGFDVSPDGARLVSFAEDGKVLRLREGLPGGVALELKAHRFAVSAARFAPEGALLSADGGRNLLDWQRQTQPKRSDFLKGLPEGAVPTALVPLSAEKVALVVEKDGEWTLTVLDGVERKALGALRVPEAPGWALSVTGRYAVTADENDVTLHAFAAPVSPLDYIKRLREWGALPVALSYARQLDAEALSPALKRQIEQELNRVPSEKVLAELVGRLREAVESQDPVAIQQWADEILRSQPAHAEALDALTRVQSLREKQLIAQAQGLYDAEQYRSAIDTLANRIPAASENAPAAAHLIRRAEEKREIQTTLIQARERMEAGLYEPAETLVNEALRRDPHSREALLLQSEIMSRTGASMRDTALIALAVLLALGFAAYLLHRTRAWWGGLLGPLALDRDKAHKPPPMFGHTAADKPHTRTGGPEPARGRMDFGREAGEFAHARTGEARGDEGLRTETARPKLARALRMEEARRLLDRTEELLRLSRQADRFQEHTAWFLELEAELNTLARRLNDPSGDPERALARLQRILGDLRNVKFKAPPQEPPANGDAEEPTYYELLQLKPGASDGEIKSAYHRLLKEYHPDRHNTSEFAWVKEQSERMTRKLGEAYQVLSDAAKREAYDRDLSRRRKPASGA